VEERTRKGLSKHPWVILVGLIASLIGIVSFVTGKQRLSDFFEARRVDTRPQDQQTQPGIRSDDTSGFHSPKSRPSSAVSTDDRRSPGREDLTSGKQGGQEPTNPSSRIETQPTEVPDVRSAPSVPSLAAGEGQAHLVPFRVLPKDTAIYLDSKFMGTAEELSGGIWIPIGLHVVTLIRPGYESQEFRALFDQAGIGVQVTLRTRR